MEPPLPPPPPQLQQHLPRQEQVWAVGLAILPPATRPPTAAQQAAAAAMEADGQGQGQDLAGVARAAAKRGRDYDKASAAAAAQPGSAAFVDYSRRAFYREFVKVCGGGVGSCWRWGCRRATRGACTPVPTRWQLRCGWPDAPTPTHPSYTAGG